MTTSAFSGLTTAEKIFYDVVWSPLVTGAETALALSMPMPFGLPVIKDIDDEILNLLSEQLYALLCEAVDIEAITLVDADAQAAYDAASLQLKVIVQESGVGSPAYATGVRTALKALQQFTTFHAAPSS